MQDLRKKIILERFFRVVLPICGGNIDTTLLGRCLERGLAADGRLVNFKVTVSDRYTVLLINEPKIHTFSVHMGVQKERISVGVVSSVNV